MCSITLWCCAGRMRRAREATGQLTRAAVLHIVAYLLYMLVKITNILLCLHIVSVIKVFD